MGEWMDGWGSLCRGGGGGGEVYHERAFSAVTAGPAAVPAAIGFETIRPKLLNRITDAACRRHRARVDTGAYAGCVTMRAVTGTIKARMVPGCCRGSICHIQARKPVRTRQTYRRHLARAEAVPMGASRQGMPIAHRVVA